MSETVSRAEFDALMSEVRYLRDRLEILDCVNLYCRGLDRLDPDLIESAYHPDAIDNHYDFIGRREKFVPYAIKVESGLEATHHGISSHNCTIDGDVAHAESYAHWFLRKAGGTIASIGSGRYIDRFERRDGQWKIARRQILMDSNFEVDGSAWNRNESWFVVGTRDREDPSYRRPFDLPAKMLAKLDDAS
jgi:hypothetical protein